LALVLVMQYAEGLSDRQAAEAVWSRIDWKYALALPLEDAGFVHGILSQFRERFHIDILCPALADTSWQGRDPDAESNEESMKYEL
jgi:hypothetical protein